MTTNRTVKRRARARAAKTGESYTTALRHVRPERGPLRVAVAGTVLRGDPADVAGLRESGRTVRRLMGEARAAGARLVLFPEGALCSPLKRVVSVDRPEVGPADWDLAAWGVLRAELEATARLARRLRLWTALGSLHPLTPPHRPHNSLYVLSDRGTVATRYDERMLSATKLRFLYTPGSAPVTFAVDGWRFGCALGMDVHFPELFADYERRDVHGVLFGTHGPGSPDDPVMAVEAAGAAALNSFWVGYAGPAGTVAPSGLVSPDGRWAARCPADAESVVLADLDPAIAAGRPWRRTARGGLYAPHLVTDDPRSADRRVL
jgi:predicted amidohydrolase